MNIFICIYRCTGVKKTVPEWENDTKLEEHRDSQDEGVW